MGAETFTTVSKGKTAAEAFKSAVDCAAYDYGHRGYTGTIAEKQKFVMIDGFESRPTNGGVHEAYQFAEKLIDDDDKRVSDKWGPAGCFKINEEEWMFFGWASC